METKQAVIIRGSVFAPVGPRRLAAVRPLERWSRNGDHLRRYRVGETISDLSAADAERLVKSGVAKLMP